MSKHKHKFWEKLRFKYRVSILNENTLSEAFHMQLSRLSVFLIVSVFAILSFLLLSLIIFLTPIKHYLPGYSDASIRTDLVEQVLYVDSLQSQLDLQAMQLAVIKDIVAGNITPDSINTDSLTMTDWKQLSLDKSQRETDFCADFEQTERYNLGSLETPHATVAQVFIKPVKGVVTHPFDPESHHLGIDVATSVDEVVLTALDGTVMMTDYSLDNGYIIGIQHADNYITFYKNCGQLLKSVGNKVNAGEAIAFVRNVQPSENATPYLHFEIWNQGQPINPTDYIVF